MKPRLINRDKNRNGNGRCRVWLYPYQARSWGRLRTQLPAPGVRKEEFLNIRKKSKQEPKIVMNLSERRIVEREGSGRT